MKNTLSMNPSSSIPARPSELTKYFKGSGTWWMRNYYFKIRSHKQIPFHVFPTLVDAKRCSSTQLGCRGRQSDEVKSPNIPNNNSHIHKRFVRVTVQSA